VAEVLAGCEIDFRRQRRGWSSIDLSSVGAPKKIWSTDASLIYHGEQGSGGGIGAD
jgi:hypothetical protein